MNKSKIYTVFKGLLLRAYKKLIYSYKSPVVFNEYVKEYFSFIQKKEQKNSIIIETYTPESHKVAGWRDLSTDITFDHLPDILKRMPGNGVNVTLEMEQTRMSLSKRMVVTPDSLSGILSDLLESDEIVADSSHLIMTEKRTHYLFMRWNEI